MVATGLMLIVWVAWYRRLKPLGSVLGLIAGATVIVIGGLPIASDYLQIIRPTVSAFRKMCAQAQPEWRQITAPIKAISFGDELGCSEYCIVTVLAEYPNLIVGTRQANNDARKEWQYFMLAEAGTANCVADKNFDRAFRISGMKRKCVNYSEHPEHVVRLNHRRSETRLLPGVSIITRQVFAETEAGDLVFSAANLDVRDTASRLGRFYSEDLGLNFSSRFYSCRAMDNLSSVSIASKVLSR